MRPGLQALAPRVQFQLGPKAAFTGRPLWRKTRRPLNFLRDDARLDSTRRVSVLPRKLTRLEAEEITERKI